MAVDLEVKKALWKYISDPGKTPTDTLVNLLSVNAVSKAGKLRRGEQEQLTYEKVIERIDFSVQLPQVVPLTKSFTEDVLDPVTAVVVPTGMYRLTMRKLLRLTLTQLQQQAELQELDVTNLDEEGIASLILINITDETPLIPPLFHMLLSKEIALVYGIRFVIPLRGPSHPSSSVTITVTPTQMTQNLDLTKSHLLQECQNQGIAVNKQENKRQLANRLVVWWTAHPEQIREPFTPNFANFLLESALRTR